MSHHNTSDSFSLPNQTSYLSQPSQLSELSFASFATQDDSDLSALSPPSRGWINEHFSKIVVEQRKLRLCRADGCTKTYAFGSSTRVFKEHWQREHSALTELKKTRFLFHDQLHINRLVKAVIDLHLDYSIVDKQAFRLYSQALNPNKNVICRQTLASLISRNKRQLVKKVSERLVDAQCVALTFDIWSARKGSRGFGCITAHYISSLGRMENLILQFERMKFPHNADTIRKFISNAIIKFDLKGKVVAITTDNASNNIAAIRMLDKSLSLTSVNLSFVHYKCAAHILDLGMKDALKELKDTIRPVREAVLAIRSSSKRKEKFVAKQMKLIELGDQLTVKPLELAEDVDHRWNSAYVLLDRAFLLRNVVAYMMATTKGMESIDKIDWDIIEEIIQFMKPFNEATKRLCHASEVTISIVSFIIPRLVEHCSKYEMSSNEWISKAARSLKSKLTDYELELYNQVVDIAYFLDPRYKTKNMSDDHRKIVLDRLRELMSEMPMPATDPTISSENSILGCDSDNEEATDELSLYCQARREKIKTDVIFWWKNNSDIYPKLSTIARRVLAIQATSVASERVFSVSGDVDTKSRNRLSDESVENIVLFKSWMQFLNIE